MALLQKQVLNVLFQGLDQKANPRTSVPGTWVDGRNWQMAKDGRITKRAGLSALPMLDVNGAAITVPRELAARNDELVLRNQQSWYARDPLSGVWQVKGAAAYEGLTIGPGMTTAATCNGTDSRLQMDAAQIGRYRLLLMAGGNAVGDSSETRWVLSDAQTGESVVYAAGSFGALQAFSVGTDGHSAAPTFVAFVCTASGFFAGRWAPNTGATPFSSVVFSQILNDMDTSAVDPNAYTLQAANAQAFPYAIVLVGEYQWLLAYQRNGDQVVVRKITYSLGTWTVSTPGTWAVSTPLQLSTYDTTAVTCAWAYNPGDPNAHLAVHGFNAAGNTISYYAIPVATLAHSGSADANSNPTPFVGRRSATAAVVQGVPIFFFDATNGSGMRGVYYWTPSFGSATDPRLLMARAGLLTHAFVPPGAPAYELGIGIAYPSTWQPSSFLLRTQWSSGALSMVALGAHLQNGNFAGCPMAPQLPHFVGGQGLPLGVLNNPISEGGPGTVQIEWASLSSAAQMPDGAPRQISDVLLLPGGMLKQYDGKQVTEAVFVLGPEYLEAGESVYGIALNAQADGSLTTAVSPNLATELMATFSNLGIAKITLESAAGCPGLPAWPSGQAEFSLWVKISNPTTGITYHLDLGSAPEIYSLGGDDGIAWQNGSVSPVVLTTSWQKVSLTISVGDLGTVTARRLWALVQATGPANDGAVLHLAIGGAMPCSLITPLPVMETGQRQYCACMAWVDATGRLQRSQMCPATTVTSINGLQMIVTVPMLNLTERSAALNTTVNPSMMPVLVEIYRTQVNSPTFYRVGAVANIPNGADVIYMDGAADTAIDANEELYTTGGVVENWPPIGCGIVESHQGRVFVVTADNQVFFSAYSQGGEALAFASEYQVETEHIPGRLTALLSLDDKLVIGSNSAYAVLAGVGPESTGLPPYDTPMAINAGVGIITQRGCARTPDGYVMATSHGVQMLDRGLNLQAIGVPITDDVAAAAGVWYCAAYHPTLQQVRLATDALVFVQDVSVAPTPNRVGQWFKWQYPRTILATALASGSLWLLDSAGAVYQADVGYSDAGAAYVQYVVLSVVSPAGVNGWARIYRVRVACFIASGSSILISFASDEITADTDYQVLTPPTGGLQHVTAKPRYGRVSSQQMWIGENAASTTAGLTIEAVALLVGNAGGLGRLPALNRLARS